MIVVMNEARAEERDTAPITATVAAKIIGMSPKRVRALIRSKAIAGERLGRTYYTTSRAARAVSHSLTTCAPFHVGALAERSPKRETLEAKCVRLEARIERLEEVLRAHLRIDVVSR